MNKFEESICIGELHREQAKTDLNEFFSAKNEPYLLERIHRELPILKPSEKSRFNTIKNRTTNESPTKVMGLDYILKNTKTGQSIIVLFRFSNDPDFYIKLTSDQLTDTNAYLSYLVDNNAHIIWVEQTETKILKHYSDLTPLSNFVKYRKGSIGGKGNENRYSYPYNPSALNYQGPDEVDLFGDCLLNQIKQVL